MCYLDFCLKRKTLFLKVNNQSLKLPSFNYDMEFSSVQKFFHRTFSPSRNNLKRNLDFFPPYQVCHTIPRSPSPTCWRPRTHSLWLAQRWTLLPEFPSRISLLQSNPLSCRPWWDQQRPGGSDVTNEELSQPDGGELAKATRHARAPALRTIRAQERVLFFSSWGRGCVDGARLLLPCDPETQNV